MHAEEINIDLDPPKKIYISGPITDMPDKNQEAFATYEKKLLKEGHFPVNPHHLNHAHDKTWGSFMKVDLKAMLDCEEIHMLPGWTHSQGAMLEHEVARRVGIKVREAL